MEYKIGNKIIGLNTKFCNSHKLTNTVGTITRRITSELFQCIFSEAEGYFLLHLDDFKLHHSFYSYII